MSMDIPFPPNDAPSTTQRVLEGDLILAANQSLPLSWKFASISLTPRFKTSTGEDHVPSTNLMNFNEDDALKKICGTRS